MGFSPETTVLATTLVQPRQLVIIASKRAERYCEQCVAFLTEHALIASEMISVRMVRHQQITMHCLQLSAMCWPARADVA